MFSKSIFWSTLVAFLFFYMVPWGFYAAADECFSPYIEEGVNRNPKYLGWLAVGVLILSYAFVRLFQRWSDGDYSNKNGFVFGFWMALFGAVSMSFIRYSTSEIAKAEYYILDGIYWIAMYVIGGFLVALISRKTS
jgi:hypothetical protein